MKKLLLAFILTIGVNAESYEALKNSCINGNSEDCITIGESYKTGQGFQQNYKKAIFYYTLACDRNNAKACIQLGDLYYFGTGVESDYVKAAFYYSKSCKLKSEEGCDNLKAIAEEKENVQQTKNEYKDLKQEQEEKIKEAELLDDI